MKRLIVHNPCNEHTRYFRYYNLFWDQLTDKLKEKYYVEENRYYELANSQRYVVTLQKGTYKPFCLMECEYVIEDLDTGQFSVLSISDDLSVATLGEADNPYLQKVLMSQFIPAKIQGHAGMNSYKYSPWIYFPSNFTDLNYYYYKRKYLKTFVDKFYFRGTALDDRIILKYFKEEYFTGGLPLVPTSYYDELITYKIGLSIAGRGELCYRDIEYMAIGIPFLRFEYQTQLYPALIPNYHYISVPYPSNMPLHNGIPLDRLGTEEHAALLEQRFLEVKDDKDFLEFISKNAREYYENYLSYGKNVEHTLNILSL